VHASEAEAKRLAGDPRVERVEADTIVRGTGTQATPPWNLDRVDQHSTVLDDKYTYAEAAGAGVSVYVMDTGVRVSHAEFGGRQCRLRRHRRRLERAGLQHRRARHPRRRHDRRR